MADLFSLKNRVVLLSGASRGLGRDMALTLAGAGATVLCAGRTVKELEATARTIAKKGGTASRVRVTATVTADKGDAGIKVVSSHLAATVEGLEGIDASTLSELAEGAEKGCPISNAIRGNVAITVEAHTA